MTYGFALITGGTTGIGAAFARLLPQSTNLLLVARNEEKLAERKAELESPSRTVETVAADLSTMDGRSTVIDKALECEIDLLINNAGAGRLSRVLDNDPEAELATVELNVVAPTVLTRALLPGMIERARRDHRRCGLILVSSTTAFQPIPLLTTYSATKSFVLAYGEGLHGKPAANRWTCWCSAPAPPAPISANAPVSIYPASPAPPTRWMWRRKVWTSLAIGQSMSSAPAPAPP
jgi:short-subunit dehydrogenase